MKLYKEKKGNISKEAGAKDDERENKHSVFEMDVARFNRPCVQVAMYMKH